MKYITMQSVWFYLLTALVTSGFFPVATVMSASDQTYEWPNCFDPNPIGSGTARLLFVHEDDLIATTVNSNSTSGVIQVVGRWNGAQWLPMGDLTKTMVVGALGHYNGDLIAGGGCYGETCNKSSLARWTGFEWVNFGKELDGYVNTMLQWGELLVVGGHFKIKGLSGVHNLAAWNGSSWQSLQAGGLGNYNRIMALAIYDGDLIIGGSFARLDGVAAGYVARYDGKRWHDLDGGTDAPVSHLTVYNDLLCVAGSFASAGGKPHAFLASWNGNSWQNLCPTIDGLEFTVENSPVQTMKNRNGQLYIGYNSRGPKSKANYGITVWDGQSWQELPTTGGISIRDLELYGDQLVACIVGNNAFPRLTNFHITNTIVTLKDNRWQWLDWNGLGVLSSKSLGLYQDELIITGRLGGGRADMIEVWRQDKWQPLLNIPAELSPETLQILNFEVSGQDVYFFATRHSESRKKTQFVLHYDGQIIHQLGQPFDQQFQLDSRLAVNDERLVLIGTVKGPRRSIGIAKVMSWSGTEWKEVTGIPSMYKVADAIGTDDGIFIAAMGENDVGSNQKKYHPVIWRWQGQEWDLVWNHDSGWIPFFHHDGKQLWAGVSSCRIGKDSPPPLLRWEAGKWQPYGEPLISTGDRAFTAYVRAMTIFQGQPMISCSCRDMGSPISRQSKIFNLYWQDGQWREFSGLDFYVEGLLAQGNRLWLIEPDLIQWGNITLTWYEGALVSEKSLATNQIALWHGFIENLEQQGESKPRQRRDEVVSLPNPISMGNVGENQIIEVSWEEYRGGKAGWFGYAPKNSEISSVETYQDHGQTLLPSLFHDYLGLGVTFATEPGSRYAVTFDYRLLENGKPLVGLANRAPTAMLQCLRGGASVDSVFVQLLPDRKIPGESGFQSVSMMVGAPGDSTWFKLSIESYNLSKDIDLEIVNFHIDKTDISLLDSYDELVTILSSRYRGRDGANCVGGEMVLSEFRSAAARATTNSELDAVIDQLLEVLQEQGMLDTEYPPATADYITRARSLNQHYGKIGFPSIKLNSEPAGSVWLSDSTFFLRTNGARGLAKLLFHEPRPFSLRHLSPETNYILDLRGKPRNLSKTKYLVYEKQVQRWLQVLTVASALRENNQMIFSYQGEDYFLKDGRLALYIGESKDTSGVMHLVSRSDTSPWLHGKIIVLANEWSDALSILALQGAPGVTVIGQPAYFFQRPETVFMLPHGLKVDFPTGVLTDTEGRNVLVKGVQPDEIIEVALEEDKTMARAMELMGIEWKTSSE